MNSVALIFLQTAVETAKTELSLRFLELNWEDTTSFLIPDEDLVRCVHFIHSARVGGGSVLVHCAQVSSICQLLGKLYYYILFSLECFDCTNASYCCVCGCSGT